MYRLEICNEETLLILIYIGRYSTTIFRKLCFSLSVLTSCFPYLIIFLFKEEEEERIRGLLIESQLKSTIKMRKQGFRYKELFFIIVTSVLSLVFSTLQYFYPKKKKKKKKKKRFEIESQLKSAIKSRKQGFCYKELFFIIVTSVLSLVSFAIFLSKEEEEEKEEEKEKIQDLFKDRIPIKIDNENVQTRISL